MPCQESLWDRAFVALRRSRYYSVQVVDSSCGQSSGPGSPRGYSLLGEAVTGICFVLAGLAILSGIQDVLAARLLSLMFLVFNLVALPPFIFAYPKNHAAWGGNAYNLAAVGAVRILADSLASRYAEQNHKLNAEMAEVS